ncbi:MAG: helix-turn-helix domain-containing protein [Pyrobaculum sp.]
MEPEERRLLLFLNYVFSDDINWRVIKALAKTEGLTLRELARRAGVAPKTLYNHLDKLAKKGVITIYKPGTHIVVISISKDYQWVKNYL